jgi:Raf kinase inhibitor-like YbhB/YbcL family protein
MSSRPDRIDVETAHEYLVEGRAQFVDARPAAVYARSGDRVPGAVHIDPGSGADIDEALKALPRERLIVVYCDEPNQAASAQVARLAREMGVGDASVLEGGFRAWLAEDMPIESNLDATRGLSADEGPLEDSAVTPDLDAAEGEDSAMALFSAGFGSGDAIPAQNALDGENLSPPLTWADVPIAARSLVLVMENRDASGAGGAPFTHWIVYNLQPSSRGLDLGANRDGLPPGCQQGRNDFGRAAYAGPMRPGRYAFRLLALDTTLDPDLLAEASRSELGAAIEGHVLAETELEGVYGGPLETQPRA